MNFPDESNRWPGEICNKNAHRQKAAARNHKKWRSTIISTSVETHKERERERERQREREREREREGESIRIYKEVDLSSKVDVISCSLRVPLILLV